jgi:putative secretion ATPase (PEP-CTERM system associated)
MYERFYNLRERPFALSPDPEYLYLSRVHREALDYLRYGLESHAGFTVITGEIGAGKTTLLQSLIQKLDSRTIVARVVNTTLDPRELLEAILMDFGLPAEGRSKPAMLRDLGQFLVQQRLEGKRPLLVVDEAQNLSTEALEEVRLLSNLETEKSKLLQIVMVGQPNLRDTLATPSLEQLRQRISVSYHLPPLDANDTEAYINYRLEHAALRRPALRFPPDAAALVHDRSRGVPRTINVICDAALVFGYAEERRDIDRRLIEEVVKELEATGVLPRHPALSATVDEPAGTAVIGSAPIASPARDVPAAAAQPSRPASAVDPRAASAPSFAHDVPPSPVGQAAPHEAPYRTLSQADQRRERQPQRDADIAARERALAERERQIAEQRRIMAEEYRLLRRDRVLERHPAVAGTSGYRSVTTGAGMGRSRTYPGVTRPRHTGPRPRANFWQRLVRLFAGEVAP